MSVWKARILTAAVALIIWFIISIPHTPESAFQVIKKNTTLKFNYTVIDKPLEFKSQYWKQELLDYIQPVLIKEIDFDSDTFRLKYQRKLEQGKILYGSMSGSIVKTPEGYVHFHRVIQFPNTPECENPYDDKGISKIQCFGEARRSIVFAEALDENFDKISFIVDIREPKADKFAGPEDARAILDPYGNIMLSFTMLQDGKHLIWSFNTTSKEQRKLVVGFDDSYMQKNWAPIFNAENELNYVYSWNPVVTIDCKEKTCEKVQDRPVNITKFRGGSGMLKYKGYYVGMTRISVQCTGAKNFRPRLTIMNSDLEIIYISERLVFDGLLFVEPFFNFNSLESIQGLGHTRVMTVGGFTPGTNGTWVMDFSINDQKNIIVQVQGLSRFFDAVIKAYEKDPNVPNLVDMALSEQDDVCQHPLTIKDKYQSYLNDIKLVNQDYRKSKTHFRSIYKCLGKQNVFEEASRRSCHFKNICYDMDKKEFQYYQPFKEPVFYDRIQGPMYHFREPFIEINGIQKWNELTFFTPKVVVGELDYKNATFHNTTTVLWAHWAHEYNLGHLIYEELGATFIAMKRFAIFNPDAQLLNMRGDIDNGVYQKFTEGYGRAISNKPIGGMESYFKKVNNGTRYLCFDDLIVASATRAFLNYQDEYSEGKEVIWEEFRDRVYESYDLDPHAPLPKKHGILFVQKTGSLRGDEDGRTHYHDIYNLVEIVSEMKKRFPEVKVRVLDPSKYSIEDQLIIMSHYSILVTPCGGVSMLTPFMPKNSHVIIMDYYGNNDPPVNIKPGKQYYQILDLETDMVPDIADAGTNYRESYSVRVNPDRLEYMIHRALMEMESKRN
ncbi:hypothetical protein HK103_006818 [Boothiomyces macroporosus]|uniref:Glycosyltransferase 61 catalytic domain-containing protein n=1 Tax=Boothiomyces macroporosus TaxID=261099 RepID=A0AAD5UD41_9FUNG|nr:hypothetical protein HK103_006818 [Boothiomyces macroporosus]